MQGPLGTLAIIGVVVVALIALVLFFFFLAYAKLWVQALASGASVSPFALIGMALRKVNANVIVENRITAI